MHLTRFVTDVYQPDAGPYLTLSMDLRPNADGRSPGQTILRSAWAGVGEGTTDIDRMFSGTIARTQDLLEEAMRDGTEGLFLIASAREPEDPWGLWVPVPGRNDLRVTERPWLAEIERLAYFTKRPVVSVFTNREGVNLMRVAFGEIETTREVEHVAYAQRKVHGRTFSENIVGAPDDYGGGHAWNKLENIIDEHQAAAAREGAAMVADTVQENDLLVIAGPEESRSDLINHLPERLREHVREHEGAFGTERERLEWSSDLAREIQLEAADQVAREVLSGERGDLIARGREHVDFMLQEGRVSQLVIHEDAVSHWGNAADARRIQAPWEDSWYGDALWRARETSAEPMFCRFSEVLHEQEGVVATLRW